MSKPAKTIGIKWISDAELKGIVDRRAKSAFGISGREFADRLNTGKVGSHQIDVHRETYELATLCSFSGGIRARKNSR
jgi:hypothetical protein